MITSLGNPKVLECTYADNIQLKAIQLNDVCVLNYTGACVICGLGSTNFYIAHLSVPTTD